jgi:alpha-glucuronidase
MKKLILSLFVFSLALAISAEDGHQLWLRYQPNPEPAKVQLSLWYDGCGTVAPSPTIELAMKELQQYWHGSPITMEADCGPMHWKKGDDGFTIEHKADGGLLLKAHGRDIGLLYGAYHLLRLQQTGQPVNPCEEHPAFSLRLLNHWDNLDGSIERGYAGESIFEWFHLDEQLIKEYARANASIGINGSVLNNVNASPKMLTTPYLKEVKKIADLLRPYNIKVYLSINFATPMALKETKTADPLDKNVARWWKKKAKEIYKLIPDFGGFLVKANSEGQPGPGDFGRTHADGANMLADALKPYNGIVMWRCFVYGANHKGEDRVKQAVSEFKPLDGKFRDNVILQTKNGPLDFQPREPYSPIFDQITKTPNMVELQITQEYLGQSRHLVYLAPMWQEFFAFVPAQQLKGIAGVANIGLDRNWCGHHFSQANWYAFGRLAWNPHLLSLDIAKEWLAQTFSTDRKFIDDMTIWMETSREACVNYMMPLGLHHIFKFDHHYGPEPDGFKASYPLEWCPVYYHKADKDGVGFDRSSKGTDAVNQYREHLARTYDNIETCPEELLLWFHHVPWTHRMKDGSTLWESLQYHYNSGVIWTESLQNDWHYKMRHFIDEQRWREVDERLQHQVENAREWRDVCLKYFGQFAEKQ